MRNLKLTLAFAVTLGTLACATGGPTPPPVDTSKPIELAGTTWKLTTSKGRLDGRTIVFKKQGQQYVGTLKDFGLQLRNVTGIREGMIFFILDPTSTPNVYTGSYEAPSADGTIVPQLINLSVVGDTLNWNLGSATWVRVE